MDNRSVLWSNRPDLPYIDERCEAISHSHYLGRSSGFLSGKFNVDFDVPRN